MYPLPSFLEYCAFLFVGIVLGGLIGRWAWRFAIRMREEVLRG